MFFASLKRGNITIKRVENSETIEYDVTIISSEVNTDKFVEMFGEMGFDVSCMAHTIGVFSARVMKREKCSMSTPNT